MWEQNDSYYYYLFTSQKFRYLFRRRWMEGQNLEPSCQKIHKLKLEKIDGLEVGTLIYIYIVDLLQASLRDSDNKSLLGYINVNQLTEF